MLRPDVVVCGSYFWFFFASGFLYFVLFTLHQYYLSITLIENIEYCIMV